MQKIIWQPLPGSQTEWCSSAATYRLFGGARGPGKTDALIGEMTRYGDNPNYKSLFLRRTHKQLSEVKQRCHRLYPQLGWKWEAEDNIWRSPAGGFIQFGHCQHEQDMYDYIGKEFQRIAYDQVERFKEVMFDEINTTCRSSDPNLPEEILATSNPGGIGHVWVKNKWIDRCPIRNRNEQEVKALYGKYKIDGTKVYNEMFDVWWQPKAAGETYVDELGDTWEYHPAYVFDNPFLMHEGSKYVRKLMALPYEKKEAYLWGNYDIFVGQYFEEFRREVHSEYIIHKIPKTWPGAIAIDYATTGWFFALVGVVDYDGNIWVIDELCFLGKSLKYKAKMIDRLIEKYSSNIKKVICPHDMYRKRNEREADDDETIIDRFRGHLEADVPIVRAVNQRIQGWDLIKEGLSWTDGETPWLRFIGDKCKKLMETLPAQVHDENNPEDLDTDAWDHGVDALRYLVMHLKKKPPQEPEDAYDRAFRLKKQPVRRSPLSWLAR